jgi:hypothetical protein
VLFVFNAFVTRTLARILTSLTIIGWVSYKIMSLSLVIHKVDIGRGVSTLRPNQRVIFKRGSGIKPFSIQAYDVRVEPQKIDE